MNFDPYATPREANEPLHPRSLLVASLWSRIAAYVIDAILIALLVAGESVPILFFARVTVSQSGVTILSPGWLLVLPAVALITQLAYHTLLVSLASATIGKFAMGLRVVSGAGDRVSMSRSLLRYIASWLSLIGIGVGYAFAVFDRTHRTLHDRIARTRVVCNAHR